MKKFLMILILSLLVKLSAIASVDYDFTLPLKGNSIVSNDIQYKVSSELFSSASLMYPTCTSFKISDTKVIYYPKNVKKKNGKIIKGNWNELWTLQSCDTKVQVPITFYINRTKTNYVFEYPLSPEQFPKKNF